jgi:hypothetical protein
MQVEYEIKRLKRIVRANEVRQDKQFDLLWSALGRAEERKDRWKSLAGGKSG